VWDAFLVSFAAVAVVGAVVAVTVPHPRARAGARVVAFGGILSLVAFAPALFVLLTTPVAWRLVRPGPERPEPSRGRLLVSVGLVTAFLSLLLLALGHASWPSRAPRVTRIEDVLGALCGPLLPATLLALATLALAFFLPRERRA
jgi:hypothetical protein